MRLNVIFILFLAILAMVVISCAEEKPYVSPEDIAKQKAEGANAVQEQYDDDQGYDEQQETQEAESDGNIKVAQVTEETYASSTKLSVQWEDESVETYKVTVTDSVTKQTQEFVVDGEETELEITKLKAGTFYTISLEACTAEACEIAGTATETTEEEYWQILGSGNSYEDVTQAVSGGSVLPYVMQYGDWAPEDVQGTTIFYYSAKPTPGEQGGVGLATQETADVFEGNAFTRLTEYGLLHPCNVGSASEKPSLECFGPSYMTAVLAFQAIPLASGNIRLLFESTDADKSTRIMYLDSDDGYYGRDFNSDDGETCISEEDWNGGCKPTIAIGIDDDEEKGDTGLTQARQFKIGYPKQESWLWDESEGTFMVITGADSCGQSVNGLFYAVWDGEDWVVQRDEEECAQPIVLNAHGPVLVDLTPTTYKLYYEEETEWGQDHQTPKPFQMIYADASQTGDENIVDIDDWEAETLARDVHFIWPNGELVSDETEPGFGDHYIYVPKTDDLSEQIMYMNLGGFDDVSWKKASYGLGIAILKNP